MNSSNLDKCYYTPEISEFHEGFRCESRYPYGDEQEKMWKPYIFTFNTYDDMPYDDGDEDRYRVKCLDRRDIEELGWEHAVFGGVEEFNKPNARLNWVQETQRVIIAKWEVEWFDVVFNGTIKNFNELQKLMKQLDIL